jgi:ankyrin repeat protein
MPLIFAASVRCPAAAALFLGTTGNVDDVNARHQTALHIAVQHEDTAIVRMLVEAGTKVDIVDIYMNTPLSKATAKLSAELMHILDAEKTRLAKAPVAKSTEHLADQNRRENTRSAQPNRREICRQSTPSLSASSSDPDGSRGPTSSSQKQLEVQYEQSEAPLSESLIVRQL